MIDIVEFKLSDSSRVVSFMNKHFAPGPDAAAKRALDSKHYCWKYAANRFGNPIGFTYQHNDEVLGIFGAIPKLVHVRGEDVPAFEVVDAFVSPECQGKGVFSTLSRATYEEIDKYACLAYAKNPTPKSFDIFVKRHGFYESFACKNLILVLDFRRGLVSVGLPSAISSVAGPFADALMKTLLALRLKGSRYLDDVREIDAFPDDYDNLWTEIQKKCDFTVVKNLDYIQWRYLDCPEPYRFYQCRLKTGETGYFVFKTGTWRESKVGYLVDILADLENPEMRHGVLAGITEIMRKEQIAIVSIDIHRESPLYGELVGTGFLPRQEPLPFLVRQSVYNFLRPEATDFNARSWVLWSGDADSI